MDRQVITQIEQGRTALGIELGSTRIKSVLIGERHAVLASGSFSWENRMENGLWTYRLEDAVRVDLALGKPLRYKPARTRPLPAAGSAPSPCS